MRRAFIASLLLAALLLIAGCTNRKVQNPIANIDSKQPDKVLFDRSMDAMKHRKYDIARVTLQTLINTYPDSEYVARAKLSVGDAWYAEGCSSCLAQAEVEYKDFITFFPNMPEAAEAQLKVANIHYKQMEKPDRDFTHARRAEDEYKQLLQQFPDSKLVPEARQRLLQVQEVLAEREYRIGYFYYKNEAWSAAIARLKTVTDSYPLYSGADEALYLIGGSYERQIELARASTLPEVAKGRLTKEFTDAAAAAYSRIITRYPAMDRVDDARQRLQALHRPVPTPTAAAIAQNKAEEESRGGPSKFGMIMSPFHRGPDVSRSVKVGDPSLENPQETSAPELARHTIAVAASAPGPNTVSVETVKNGTPPPNEPLPRSGDATPAGGAQPAPPDPNLTLQDKTAATATQDSSGDSGAAPAPMPSQVNEAGADESQAAPAGASDSKADKKTESSSKTKKKKGLRKLIPF